MRELLSSYLARVWNNIINVGIYPFMPYIEARRTKLLNLMALPGACLMFIYVVINIVTGRYTLAALNLLNMSSAVTLLVLHKQRMYLSARLVLIGISIIIYTISGLYFHNGAEYLLLLLLIAIILIYDKWWVVICLGGLAIIAFIAVVLFPQPAILGKPVSQVQVWSNIIGATICILVNLVFFKHIQTDNQRAIEKQRQALLAMNKDKEKLFSILAHDIRGPLATLEGVLDMFHQGLVDNNYMKDTTSMLQEKISQFGGTLDNLLRWSTRSMQGIQTTPTNFSILSVLEEVIDFFDLAIQQKKIRVDIRVPPQHFIRADRDQVAVIFRNLFSNALKFSNECGAIRIATTETDHRISIRISDEGIGMSHRQVNTLFTSSRQPQNGTSGERGFGLGLLLSHEFTVLNQGTIQVESHPGKGTAFTILLPKGAPGDEDDDDL
ncbi:signal transduction histidine kinase [Chitinophaga terrae (ex Kim and Jung 2007)]|uniref:sensor histidine kinase n=1 Tax=Chitinophaga terrae (ex Kim and Jung 2007) TaxID=408074 RepID=UPI00278A5DBD|nr:HAMP domain-containing sensor histidine kinase [Chitinophaga terrae (ex Kim and Jung 2007)]MDQ0107396.1 signal transduction histidine kinase [Chitinophaga terrae (ex Kim and Jung 2007)]